jgi:translocation and assembly module TamB
MASEAHLADDAPPPSAPRHRRWLRALVAVGVLAALLVAAGGDLLSSQAALDWVIGRALLEAQGRLAIEGATGSLLDTVRIARLTWRGDDVDVEAQDASLSWSPTDLLSRRFNVSALHARRIALTLRPSADPAAPLPQNLALPLEVNLRNVGVERLDWRMGARAGAIDDIAFDYAGGAQTHSLRRLRLATAVGAVSGEANLGAAAPFALQGTLAFDGSGDLRDVQARADARGTLSVVELSGTGSTRDATVAAQARVAPLADVPLLAAHIDARDVDLRRFAAGLPSTRLTVVADARPAPGGFTGTLAVGNADAGALDAGRIPLTSLASDFVWNGDEIALDALHAELAGNGRITGRAVVPVHGGASRWQLAVRDVDLNRLQSKLIATRLAGTLTADVAQAKQTVRGEFAQADLSLAFAATIADGAVDIERFRGRAGGSEITGRGRAATAGARGFDVTAQLVRFDPSRFGAFPAGSLDGSVAARGVLSPAWDVAAEVTLRAGSRLDGAALNGSARGRASAGAVRDVAAAFALASATIKLEGSVGAPGDRLHYRIDVDKVADLRALLAHLANVTVPEAIAGSVHAHGTLLSEPGGNGIDLDLSADGLQWGPRIAVATLRAKTAIGAGGMTLGAAANAARTFAIDAAATGVRLPQGELATVNASVTGTLAHHTAKFYFKGADIDAQVHATGGVPARAGAAADAAILWSGTLDTLSNRGLYAFALDAPTPVEWGPGRLHVGTAHVAVAEGRALLDEFLWDGGRITTRGTFGGIPVLALARLAGTKLPVTTTLVVGGDWSLAANPRLTGTLRVHREGGDIYGADSLSSDRADLALGITTLALDARFADDGVDATATLRSQRAGNADARLAVAAPPDAPRGRISHNATVSAALTADLPSLRPLQPWLPTIAVLDGNAHVDLQARGTLDAPTLAGTFRGDDMRVDLPQYGVNLTQGRLRAHIADQAVVLDELTFTGGEGRFTAQGTLTRAEHSGGTGTAPLGQVTWKATNFRVVNRPDLRLVAGGSGSVAVEGGKLTLLGNVEIVEGRIDYAPTTSGALGSDVVIVGRPRRTEAAGAPLDLPLALDIDVVLGHDLRFTGDGFDTELTGRLRVTTARNGTLATKGTIRTVNGTYFAFGQRLDIDRGQLIFDGPADNPALDVVALRRNLAVEAGVEVTGTVRVPRVRLVSNPPVPDGEKLSWLVTGQGLDRASRADLAALGAASASLLGAGQKPLTTTIANSIGLDDISLRSSSTNAIAGTQSQVVAFGKRISDRLTLVYEQGLTLATNALRIEYTLSHSLTLRAEAGVVSSIGLYFRRTYD